ncbi:MAG: porin family protein [Methylocystis sp.]|nr:porin family protein [Methylocystis sp.]
MKKVILTSAAMALALSAGSALAADLITKGPPVAPPPLFTWTGLYVGVNAGFTWSETEEVNLVTAPTIGLGAAGGLVSVANAVAGTAIFNLPNDSFIGGGQAGYNLQFGAWVGGVEVDFQGLADADRTAVLGQVVAGPVPGQITVSALTVQKRLDWLGTLRARVGYLVMPNLLVYGTGGMAVGGASLSASITEANNVGGLTNPFGNFGTFDETRVGWTAGAGLEYMFWPNWSAKVEYLFYDLGDVTNPLSPLTQTAAGTAIPVAMGNTLETARFDGHIVRAGLNYHFNLATPVIASF